MLILPGSPLFDLTLATPPPNWREAAARDGDTFAFVVGLDGIARPVTAIELEDYLEGGEYDERLIQTDDLDEEVEEGDY
jgi:hypothetical protein